MPFICVYVYINSKQHFDFNDMLLILIFVTLNNIINYSITKNTANQYFHAINKYS